MKIEWENGARIDVHIDNGTAVISANEAGLLSLAAQLTALSKEAQGSHIHYDEHNSLEEGAVELIIEKTE